MSSPSSMNPPKSNNEDDIVFFDAIDDFPFYDCTGDDQSEPSGSTTTTSTLCDPESVGGVSQNSSPATSSQPRKIRRRPTALGYGSSSIGSESDLFNDVRARLRQQRRNRNQRNLTENEEAVGKSESNQAQVSSFTPPNVVREDNNEESTITTAANEAAGESTDSAVVPGDSFSNLLEKVAGLVIKAIGFQINLFIMFMTFPLKFIYYSCMLFMDPFLIYRSGIGFLIWISSRMWDVACGFISPSARRWLREHKSIWKVALRWAWGFLWSIYVCLILCSLMVSSIIMSGFMMKFLAERPVQMKEILNFDYTKQIPVAYVPIISCDGVGGWEDFENRIGISKGTGARVIPPRNKVQVTVSLVVPESEYNRNLGIFQVRVDFLSSDGKIIAKSSQPCMLRFRSEPIRLLVTLLKIFPLITGYVSETQNLNVKMRGFIEHDVPTSCLKVTLEHRAEYRHGGGIPEIYDASLVLESELPFFKRIIWYWKKTIFIWITMSVFIMEILFALVCCRPIILPRTRQRGASTHSTSSQNNLPAQS